MSQPTTKTTYRETRARLRLDRARLRALQDRGDASRTWCAALQPSLLCTRLHRWSHYWHGRGFGKLARALWHLNLLLTGADIHPRSDLGGGLWIPHPAAVSLSARAGTNLTVMALAGAGGLLPDRTDIGAGPGLPVLGDDVFLAPHSGVLGPVRIGHRVRLAPGSIATRDLPDDTVLEPAPIKVLPRGKP